MIDWRALRGIHGPRAARAAALVLTGLALSLAFLSTRTPDAAPSLRLRETRLDFVLHLTCLALFLLVLWRRLRARRPIFMWPPHLLALALFLYLGQSAWVSPVPGAGLESWALWFDALLLFWAAMAGLADDVEITALAMAGILILLGVVGFVADAIGPPQMAIADWPIALGGGLLLMGAAVCSGAAFLRNWSDSRRFVLLVFWMFAGLALLAALSGNRRTGPSDDAAARIAEISAMTGAGLGVGAEILPSFATRDFAQLPPPGDSLLALRVEIGWLGVGLLALLIGVSALIGLRHIVRQGHSRPILFAFGLAGTLGGLLWGAWLEPTLSRPFGRALMFVILGLLLGLEAPSPALRQHRAPMKKGVIGGLAWPGAALFAGAAILALVAVTLESRPWRAARLTMIRSGERLADAAYGERLERAVAIYPQDPGAWARLAAHRRERLNSPDSAGFSEEEYAGAVEAYERAIRANPYQYRHHWSLSYFHSLAARHEPAVASARRGLEYLPYNEALQGRLIGSLMDSRQTAEAITEMKLMARSLPARLPPGPDEVSNAVNPAWIEIHFRIAQLHEERGEYSRALDQYAIAYQKDPHGRYAALSQAGIERMKARIVEPEEEK